MSENDELKEAGAAGKPWKERARKILFALEVVVAIAALIVLYYRDDIQRYNQSRRPPQLAAGEAAPEINASGWLNGGPVSVAGSRGSVIVVEFWASWCKPCMQAMPHMIDLYNRYRPKGVVFAALSDEWKIVVEKTVSGMNMPFPAGYGSTSSEDYGVDGIPRAFVIGRDGKIKWCGHSEDATLERAIIKELEAQ